MAVKIWITYVDDYRKSNPKLHKLYASSAYRHLMAIDRMISELESFSNINMLDITIVMQNERDKLVRQNAAYAEASNIIANGC